MLLFISGFFSSIMLFINRKAKKSCALRQFFLAAQQAVLCFCIFFINLNKKEHIRKYKTIYFYKGCFAILHKLKISINQTKGKLAKLFCKTFLCFWVNNLFLRTSGKCCKAGIFYRIKFAFFLLYFGWYIFLFFTRICLVTKLKILYLQYVKTKAVKFHIIAVTETEKQRIFWTVPCPRSLTPNYK